MKKKLIGADFLLLLLYLNNKEPINGAVRLTKMMFLFNEQIAPALKNKGLDSEKLPHFIAYNYGPFSKDVYDQIELFSGINFVKTINLNTQEQMIDVDDVVESEFIDECYLDDNELKNDNKYLQYAITEYGSGFVESELLAEINEEQRYILEAFKNKITTMPINQLLYYVYTKYPDYTENSIIKDEVLHYGE